MSMQITQNEHQVKRCEHVETECEVSLSKAESAVRIGSRGWESLRVSAGNQLILISSPQQTVSRFSQIAQGHYGHTVHVFCLICMDTFLPIGPTSHPVP